MKCFAPIPGNPTELATLCERRTSLNRGAGFARAIMMSQRHHTHTHTYRALSLFARGPPRENATLSDHVTQCARARDKTKLARISDTIKHKKTRQPTREAPARLTIYRLFGMLGQWRWWPIRQDVRVRPTGHHLGKLFLSDKRRDSRVSFKIARKQYERNASRVATRWDKKDLLSEGAAQLFEFTKMSTKI